MIDHQLFPKIARLNRDIVITEKIDGTNAAVGIVSSADVKDDPPAGTVFVCDDRSADHADYFVYAQSRSRIITPDADNFGFARWVADHSANLVAILGPGLHFGEWWGSGIQRGYGLSKGDKRFSLFNTKRWGYMNDPDAPEWADVKADCLGLGCVPVLYEGPFDKSTLDDYLSVRPCHIQPWYKALEDLHDDGSVASPGFMDPEGIVMYHKAANQMFKVTLEGDEEPKSLKKAA